MGQCVNEATDDGPVRKRRGEIREAKVMLLLAGRH